MPFESYSLSCYLLDRLVELGCDHLFGVPGDYNLRFLDDVMCHQMKWVGCANELNAAYATDGYARRRGIGAILTTCGVGELSAVNGIAGCAAESVPVVHIVGAPSLKSATGREKVHHTLGDGDFTHFQSISAQLCCSAVTLNPGTAITEIDRVLLDVVYNKKPGYIALPADLAEMPVKPPTARLCRRPAQCNPDSLAAFKAALTARFSVCKEPAVLVGHLVERHELSDAANHFFEHVNIPYAVAALGKGAVNEHLANCVGSYFAGSLPSPAKATVESADVCVLIGVEMTDCVTGNFHQKIDMANAVDIQPFFCRVGDEQFQQVPMAEALKALEEVCLRCHGGWSTSYPKPETFKAPQDPDAFDYSHFWNEMQKSLLPGDLIIVDLGTAAFSSLLLNLPKGANYISQQMWASIGYSMPAALGAQIAEPDRRIICIVGDGALQMTVQELGTFSRHGLNTNFFLINNSGFTIERFIRGARAPYNDIAAWDWKTTVSGLCAAAPLQIESIDQPGKTAEVMKTRKGAVSDLLFAEVVVGMFEGPLRTPIPLPLQPN